jgi:folate-binding protein YgfZ
MQRVGAVGDDVPSHYGDPMREQRSLADGRSLVDCSHYGVIALSGADRLIWLDSITSNVFAGIAVGDTREGLVLYPQGRIEHQFFLADDGEESWLLVEPGRATALATWLDSMRFRMDVRVDEQSTQWAVVASTSDTVSRLNRGAVVWRDPWPDVQPGGAAYSAAEHPGTGWDLAYLAIPRDELSEELADEWSGIDALEALQVRAGRPTMADVDEKALPHELDWLRTSVHLNKGCYRGQETVAKVHNLGHPPRRAVLLHLDGSQPGLPEPGTAVTLADDVVGRVTRAVRHHEWGQVALAVIKRTVSPDAMLSVIVNGEAVNASQELLVLPESGATRREALAARRNASP